MLLLYFDTTKMRTKDDMCHKITTTTSTLDFWKTRWTVTKIKGQLEDCCSDLGKKIKGMWTDVMAERHSEKR